MAPVTEARGEFELELLGVRYGLRPSNEAIDAFEAGTGRSVLDLYAAATARTLRRREVGIIVGECVRAWGRRTGDDEVASFRNERLADLVMEAPGGLLVAQTRLAIVLLKAATGGVTAQGEPKAMPDPTETD